MLEATSSPSNPYCSTDLLSTQAMHLTKVCQIQVKRFHFLVILISRQILIPWIQKQGQHFILDMPLCFPTHLQFQHSILYIHLGHHTTILQVRKEYKVMINWTYFLCRYCADIFGMNSQNVIQAWAKNYKSCNSPETLLRKCHTQMIHNIHWVIGPEQILVSVDRRNSINACFWLDKDEL